MKNVKQLIGSAVVLCALAGATDANAAQRFVAPGGTGTTCTEAAPCSIVTGINSAPADSEVIIAPGTYSPGSALNNVMANVNVHGVSAATKPIINGAPGATALSVTGNAASVADVIVNSATNQSGLRTNGQGVTIQRVEVHSNGSSACGILSTGVVRDSLCVDTSVGGYGFLMAIGGNASMKLRNVTAIATGGGTSTAIGAIESGQTMTIDAKNVIAFGTGRDVEVKPSTPSTVTINFENSNFVTVVNTGTGTGNVTPAGTGTNQTGMPLFTDTTSFRQAPGSPTIDAGAVDADTGTTDVDGQARVQGPQIDIGADEAADLTPPEGAITSHPKPKTKAKVATFEFSSSEVGSTFTCQVDTKAAAPCTSPLTIKHVKKGRHRLTLTTTDPAGNLDPSPEIFKWKVSKRHNLRHHHGHH